MRHVYLYIYLYLIIDVYIDVPYFGGVGKAPSLLKAPETPVESRQRSSSSTLNITYQVTTFSHRGIGDGWLQGFLTLHHTTELII